MTQQEICCDASYPPAARLSSGRSIHLKDGNENHAWVSPLLQKVEFPADTDILYPVVYGTVEKTSSFTIDVTGENDAFTVEQLQ